MNPLFEHNSSMNKNNNIPIQQIGFTISFENIIPEDDSVRLLYNVAEGLDYTESYKTYSNFNNNLEIARRFENNYSL